MNQPLVFPFELAPPGASVFVRAVLAFGAGKPSNSFPFDAVPGMGSHCFSDAFFS